MIIQESFVSKKEDRIIFFCMCCILACAFLYNTGKIYNIVVTDEIGYWASAAFVNGIKWNDLMSHSEYYGYGYGFILAPLFLISDYKMAYIIACLINICLVILSYYITCDTLFLLYHGYSKNIIFVTFATMFYPYTFVFSHMTMNELQLLFLYMLLLHSVVKFLDMKEFRYVVYVSILQFMLLSFHLREILIVLGVFIAMNVSAYLRKEKEYYKYVLLYIVFTVLGVIAVFVIKDLFTKGLYMPNNLGLGEKAFVGNGVNDNPIAIGLRITRLFSIEGIWSYFKIVVCRLFYLMASTYLFIFFGIEELLDWLVKLKNNSTLFTVALMLLSVFLIGLFGFAIIMNPGQRGRVDQVLYGRYMENTIPFLMNLGLIGILNKNDNLLRKMSWGLLVFFISGKITSSYYNETGIAMNLKNLLAFQISGVCGYAGIKSIPLNKYLTSVVPIIVMILLLVFITISQRSTKCGCLFLALCLYLTGMSTIKKFIYNFPQAIDLSLEQRLKEYEDIDDIVSMIELMEPEDVYYAYNKEEYKRHQVSELQFALFKKELHFIEDSNFGVVKDDDVLIVQSNSDMFDELLKEFDVVSEGNEDLFTILQRGS